MQVADEGGVQPPGLEGFHRSIQRFPVVDDLLDVGTNRTIDRLLRVRLEPQDVLKRRLRPLDPRGEHRLLGQERGEQEAGVGGRLGDAVITGRGRGSPTQFWGCGTPSRCRPGAEAPGRRVGLSCCPLPAGAGTPCDMPEFLHSLTDRAKGY